MNFKALTLLLLSVAAAVGAVISANSWMQNQVRTARPAAIEVSSAEPADSREVLVAKRSLPSGTLIQEKHLEWKRWPKSLIFDRHITRKDDKNIDDFVSAVVRSGFAEGEPIVRNRIVHPGERGFLAAVLKPGMRAVSVPVNATTGIAGFVFPGDHVDLILTHGVDEETGKIRRASETALTNIRVLAVDQSIDDQEGKPSVAKNVTLELTSKQAEQVTLLQDLGRLYLSLRSLARADVIAQLGEEDGTISEFPPEREHGHTWDSEVSILVNPPPALVVVRGTEAVAVSF